MTYPYLNDEAFLKQVAEETYHEQFVRLGVLEFKSEKLIANIEGKVTAGSCNLNGASSMRRSLTCTVAVDPYGIEMMGYDEPQYYSNVTEVQNLISINKKIKVETGFTNTFEKYTEYDTIWLPLGVYIIKSANVVKSTSGFNISLTLNDKCALLNGDLGGIIPAATIFSESDLYNASGSMKQTDKILIKDIIKNLVVEFGGEQPDNVIITDIEDYILKVMKWSGDKPLYFVGDSNLYFTLEEPRSGINYTTYSFGDNVGYEIEPFAYPGTLECNAGDTVSAMLDKIKNTLGNFEWFYDVEGRFIFQQKKNYLNTSLSSEILQDGRKLKEADYLSNLNQSKIVYTFDETNKHIVSSISSAPQLQNVKNDYVVWGTAKTASGADKPIRYHLAFDSKPATNINQGRLALVYTDYRGLQQVAILKEGENFHWWSANQPMSDKQMYYLIAATDSTGTIKVFHWDIDVNCFREYDQNYEVCYLVTDDWRTELYFRGLENNRASFSNNYYAAELNSEWTKIYDVKKTSTGTYYCWGEGLEGWTKMEVPAYKGDYREDVTPANYEFWLDFIVGDSGTNTNVPLSQFNVNNIGRRVKVVSESAVNCIFTNEIPNYVLIEADGDVTVDINLATLKGQTAIQVSPEIYAKLVLGGAQNSAYDKVCDLLAQHTNYNETITLSTSPIYHLEPNSLISIVDEEMGVNGQYIISTISIPLAVNGTSNITATRALIKL